MGTTMASVYLTRCGCAEISLGIRISKTGFLEIDASRSVKRFWIRGYWTRRNEIALAQAIKGEENVIVEEVSSWALTRSRVIGMLGLDQSFRHGNVARQQGRRFAGRAVPLVSLADASPLSQTTVDVTDGERNENGFSELAGSSSSSLEETNTPGQFRYKMSKFLRVDFRKQPWGYARIGGVEMSASLSVHDVGAFGVGIGNVVAVSHVWGDAQYVVENVQGASYQIKISSPEKMRRLLSIAQRYGWENLWLDNICINQEDHEEKSREVMKMGYVYRETKGTVILLDSTRSELLEEIMPTILQFKKFGKGVPFPDDILPPVDWEACMNRCVQLGQDEWYERLWTVQESTLALSLYMAPVNKDFLFDVSVWRDCGYFWRQLVLVVSGMGWISGRSDVILNLANRWLAHAKLTMFEALLATSRVKCSVERDRVYGILGLIPDVNITPRYVDASLEGIVVTVMKECVNNLKQMDLLHLRGPKLEEMGKRMVPTWTSLRIPQALHGGLILHTGNCTYGEDVGLMVSSPRVFLAKIVTVIEAACRMEWDAWRLFWALKQKLHDDQIVELIRGMLDVWEYPPYGKEVKAREYFNIWAHVASLPFDTNMSDVLMGKYGMTQRDMAVFDMVWQNFGADGGGRMYILGFTKDSNCPCSCCKRPYICAMPYDAQVEDNLIVVDYGGHIYNPVEGKDKRLVPLIVALPVQEGVMKFISTVVVDRGILHESMASQRDAISIV